MDEASVSTSTCRRGLIKDTDNTESKNVLEQYCDNLHENKTSTSGVENKASNQDSSLTVCSNKVYNNPPSTKAILCVYISLFAIIGCSVRTGLDLAFGKSFANIENPGTIIFKSFFSNLLGCFLFGLIQETTLNKRCPLYVGLTTGFCGCLTTYSKWNQQISLLLIGAVNVDSQTQVVAFFGVVVSLLSYVCSYFFGKDVMNILSTVTETNQGPRNRQENKISCPHHPTAIAVLLLSFIVLTTMSIIFWSRTPPLAAACFSGLMSPFGAVLRYVLSKVTPQLTLKGKFSFLNHLPTGTLVANITGCLATALSTLFQSLFEMDCAIHVLFTGLQNGFVASLTTISTFTGEIVSLHRLKNNRGVKASYFYVTISVTVCIFVGSVVNFINMEILKSKYTHEINVTDTSFLKWVHNLHYC